MGKKETGFYMCTCASNLHVHKIFSLLNIIGTHHSNHDSTLNSLSFLDES
jgi:hypothetical protein